ncbi:MAG: SH3 domain-containing protein, partial [Clostridium sp.]|nr:SH3 domain-containing protein [Clostridium sp.]
MINRNILKLVVASSTIMGGIGLTANTVQAVEKNNNVNKNELTKDATKVSTQMKGKVVNVSSNLNVRIDAGTNYDTIGYVYNNQNIEILSEKNDWYRISFNGREGYVSKKYISVENAVLESKAQANKIKGKVINVNSILNIRQSTESNSAILGTLRNGDTFDIISKTGDWYNIRSNNIVGFVKATYVQRIEQNEVAMQNVINTIIQDYNVNKCESKISIQKGKVKNVSSNLRVRSAASTSAQIVGYLLNGSEVTIKGEVGNWYIIDFNGRNGFVTKEYIQKGSVQAIDSSTSSSKKGKVVNISSSLNIRSGAGTGHSIVGRLTNGATVDILGKNGGWYHVNSNGVTGYVSAEYLKEESSASGTQESKSTYGSTSSSKKGKVVNISSSLNIRSGAGTGHSIVGRLTNGVT